jgi:hypothetical protein
MNITRNQASNEIANKQIICKETNLTHAKQYAVQ